jgi:hypothetical protein
MLPSLWRCRLLLSRRKAARSASLEGLGRRTVRALSKALDRRAAQLAVHGAVVLDLHPGLSRFVEEAEDRLRVTVEHGQQPALDIPPEGLLLAVMVGAAASHWTLLAFPLARYAGKGLDRCMRNGMAEPTAIGHH